MSDIAVAAERMLEGHRLAFAAHVSTPADVIDAPRMAELYAYAAECVRRVPELEAKAEAYLATLHDYYVRVGELQDEAERLRAKAAIVDAMERGEIRVSSSGTHGWSVQAVREGDEAGPSNRWHTAPTLLAAYAAATREGTDA